MFGSVYFDNYSSDVDAYSWKPFEKCQKKEYNNIIFTKRQY